MKDATPSLNRKPAEPWDQILLRVIQLQGAEIFQGILQRKASGREWKPPEFSLEQVRGKLTGLNREWAVGKATSTFAAVQAGLQGLRRNWQQLRHGPNRREPLEKAALETLSGVGFVGGILFGLQLPQIDLKLSAKGKERDSLILHAAALMMTEVSVEWVQEVLRRTLLSAALGPAEARFIRAISKVLETSLRGVERGWSARQVAGLWMRFWRSPIVKQHHVATDARAIQIAQQWIERLK
jgi:hypothetical protein